jgi:hypothetical protein
MQVRSVRIVCVCWKQGVCFILSSITAASSDRKPESADIFRGRQLPCWEERKNRSPVDCSLSSGPGGQPARLLVIPRVFNALDYADFNLPVPSTFRFPNYHLFFTFAVENSVCVLSYLALFSVAAFSTLNSAVLLSCKYCLPFQMFYLFLRQCSVYCCYWTFVYCYYSISLLLLDYFVINTAFFVYCCCTILRVAITVFCLLPLQHFNTYAKGEEMQILST